MQAKLREECSPPRILGWVKRLLDHLRLAEWHEAHEEPKWLEGDLWHAEQRDELVWRNFQEPVRWHCEHEPDLWPLGREWHPVQLDDELGWLKAQDTPLDP